MSKSLEMTGNIALEILHRSPFILLVQLGHSQPALDVTECEKKKKKKQNLSSQLATSFCCIYCLLAQQFIIQSLEFVVDLRTLFSLWISACCNQDWGFSFSAATGIPFLGGIYIWARIRHCIIFFQEGCSER